MYVPFFTVEEIIEQIEARWRRERKSRLHGYQADVPKEIRKNFTARNTMRCRRRLARAIKRSDRQQWRQEAAQELAEMLQPQQVEPAAILGHLEYAVAGDDHNVVGRRTPNGSIEEVTYVATPDSASFTQDKSDPAEGEDTIDTHDIRAWSAVSPEAGEPAELRKMGFHTVALTKTGNLRGVRSNPSDYAKADHAEAA